MKKFFRCREIFFVLKKNRFNEKYSIKKTIENKTDKNILKKGTNWIIFIKFCKGKNIVNDEFFITIGPKKRRPAHIIICQRNPLCTIFCA